MDRERNEFPIKIDKSFLTREFIITELWAATQIDAAEIQQPFWDQQRAILTQLQAAWAKKPKSDATKKLSTIEEYLTTSPFDTSAFRFELNKMMETG